MANDSKVRNVDRVGCRRIKTKHGHGLVKKANEAVARLMSKRATAKKYKIPRSTLIYHCTEGYADY